jgi:hypothetical protein
VLLNGGIVLLRARGTFQFQYIGPFGHLGKSITGLFGYSFGCRGPPALGKASQIEGIMVK